LTGLLNRRGLDAGLAALAAAAPSTVAIALIDIDHFKSINDRHSHAVGDRVLAHVAGAIRQHARAGDLAVRLGGDEFALVLGNAGVDDGRRVADRLLAALSAGAADGMPEVSVSIGVAACGPRGDFAAALAAADRALYAAKAGGRARVADAG
jgi:diguanylate cyclase (GGDEF)-like protein